MTSAPGFSTRMLRLFALLLAAAALFAAPLHKAAAQGGPAFTQQELDQILAPIALYPDALLAQITMASTYPLEVVEAERWSAANPRLRGAEAVQAVERRDWDPSVKSLVAFPQILRMMSDKLEWTEQLGDAFLGQEQQVMETVQYLRNRAYESGNLRSNDLARVESQGDYITIEQADPRVAYEPYYNPSVVYGAWWWPRNPPVYWAPWPGYRERPGFGSGVAWGPENILGAEFFYGAFDWRQQRVTVINVNNYYYPRDTRVAVRAPSVWRHDPDHRRGAPYRVEAVRERFHPANAPFRPGGDVRARVPEAPVQRERDERRPDARFGAGRPAETRTAPPAVIPGHASAPVAAPAPIVAPAAPAPGNRPEWRDGRGNRSAERGSAERGAGERGRPQSVDRATTERANETSINRANANDAGADTGRGRGNDNPGRRRPEARSAVAPAVTPAVAPAAAPAVAPVAPAVAPVVVPATAPVAQRAPVRGIVPPAPPQSEPVPPADAAPRSQERSRERRVRPPEVK